MRHALALLAGTVLLLSGCGGSPPAAGVQAAPPAVASPPPDFAGIEACRLAEQGRRDSQTLMAPGFVPSIDTAADTAANVQIRFAADELRRQHDILEAAIDNGTPDAVTGLSFELGTKLDEMLRKCRTAGLSTESP